MTTPFEKELIVIALALTVVAVGFYAWEKLWPSGPGEGFVSGNGRIEATEIDVATKLAGRVQSRCCRAAPPRARVCPSLCRM